VLVTREADYAIRCVLEVARHGRLSAAQVADAQDISRTFLGKIVQSLAKAGILSTRRGVGGGVSLGAPPEEITLLAIIEAIEGPLALNECLTSAPDCLYVQRCPAYPFLSRAQEALRGILNVTVASMLESPPRLATDVVPVLELGLVAPVGALPEPSIPGGDAP
jgi:Rrf2 family protein